MVEHCAPTLASLKMGSLFNYAYQTKEELSESIDYWNGQMREKGIQLIVLRERNCHALIYVCRVATLEKELQNQETAAFLKNYGYSGTDPGCVMERLKARLEVKNRFPHEIGVFLGYPLEDVIGFIENMGKNFRYSGMWKVYGDREKAEELFGKYKKCRDIYTILWENGKSVQQLTVAA